MEKDLKICLPLYKLGYAAFFIVVLSFVRGVSYNYEIGIALEAPVALLTFVFCADTYVQELVSGRSEIIKLCPVKKRLGAVGKRMVIQVLFLQLLSMAGYGLFYLFQQPQAVNGFSHLFLTYEGAILVSICFWGILSLTLSCLFRNQWLGIGCCLLLWVQTNSTFGDRFLGKWNLFSYSFREIEDGGNLDWLWGKGLCVGLSIFMAALLPVLLKKRG